MQANQLTRPSIEVIVVDLYSAPLVPVLDLVLVINEKRKLTPKEKGTVCRQKV